MRPARSSTRSSSPARRGPASPGALARAGSSSQRKITRAERADRGARDPVAALHDVRARQAGVGERADREPEGLAEQSEPEDEREHGEQPAARRRAGERGHEVRDEPDRDDERGGEPGPRQRPGDEPEPVPADRRERDPREDHEVEDVHLRARRVTARARAGARG